MLTFNPEQQAQSIPKTLEDASRRQAIISNFFGYPFNQMHTPKTLEDASRRQAIISNIFGYPFNQTHIPKTLEDACRQQVNEAPEHSVTMIGLSERSQHPGIFKGDGYIIFI